MNKKTKTNELVLLGLLAAVLIVMSCTPLGFLNIGPLAITLNIIPVAIAAVAIGPKGGLTMGAIFGIMSFLQCIGIGGTSLMGATLFEINPVLAFLQRFLPRALDGFLVALIYIALRKKLNVYVSSAIAGFCSAFLNTLFFMSSLILMFGNTDYVKGLIDGRNVFVFVCAFVGINAVFEMIASTIITCAVCTALHKAKLLPAEKKEKLSEKTASASAA